MKRLITSSSSVLLGFSAAVGALLAVSVVAFADTGSGQVTAARASVDPTTLLDSFSDLARSGMRFRPRLTRELRTLSSTAPSDALAPGDPVAARSRRVTHDDGTTFFLVPTTRKQLCIAVVPGGAAGCTAGIGLAEDGVEFQLVDSDGLGQGDRQSSVESSPPALPVSRSPPRVVRMRPRSSKERSPSACRTCRPLLSSRCATVRSVR